MDSKVLDDTNLFETYNGYFSGDQAPLRLSGNSSVVLPKGADVGKVQQEVTYDENKQLTEGENVIGTVTYRYQNKVVGSNDIIYDYRTDVNHLDQASREMVGAQIIARAVVAARPSRQSQSRLQQPRGREPTKA